MAEEEVVVGDTSRDMKWRREYFDKQWDYVKKFEENLSKYAEQSNDFAKMESTFARGISDRYDGVVPKHEECRFPDVERFFEDFAGIFTGMSIHRKDVLKHMQDCVGRRAKEIQKDVGEAQAQFKEYSKTFQAFKTARKKMDGLQAELKKAENETRKQSSIKAKKKKKEIEKKKLEAVEKEFVEFEKIQKFATFMEERTKNEFDYQLQKGNKDFVLPLYEVIKKYQSYHEKMSNRLGQMMKRYKMNDALAKYKPSSRKTDIKIKTVSDEFLPISQKRIFGVDIELVMTRPHETGLIPRYVKMMIEFIDRHREHVGIFRLPGNKEGVEYMKRHMDNCKLQKLDDDRKNINNVASLLKEYFRDLPSSFAPVNYFEPIERLESEKEKVDFLRTNAVKKLTPANHQTFYRLFRMFKEITLKKETNKMGATNLAVCWAMNIFQVAPGTNPMEIMKLNTSSGKIFSFIVDHYDQIWPRPPRPPKYRKKKFAISKTDLKEMGKKVLKSKGDLVSEDIGEEEEEEEELEEFAVLEKNVIRNDCEVTQVISMDKRWIIAGDAKGIVKIYPLEKFGVDPMAKYVFRGQQAHKGAITCLEKVESGKFVTGSADGTCIIWKVGSVLPLGLVLPMSQRENKDEVVPVTKVVVGKKCKMLLVASGRYLCGANLQNGKVMVSYEPLQSEITQVAESPTGVVYVTTRDDGKLYEFNGTEPKPSNVFTIGSDTPDNYINIVAVSRKKGKVLVGCLTGKYALFENILKKSKPMVMNTRKKNPIKFCTELNRRKDIFGMLFPPADSSKGDEVAIAIGAAGIVKKSNLPDGCHVLGMEKWRSREKSEVHWFFLWDDKQHIRIYNQEKEVKSFQGHGAKINRVAPFLGNKYFVSCSDDKTIRLWDIYEDL